MGSIKDRNGKDLTEAEEIKKRWQEYMEELYKKGLNDLENHYGVVIYLEPYIPEWEIKSRTLGSITRNKASGGIGISAGLFQILKDDSVKVKTSKNCFYCIVQCNISLNDHHPLAPQERGTFFVFNIVFSIRTHISL